MMFALINNAFLSIVAAAIPASCVIVLAATGAMLNEKVGVLNLGQEGLIGVGAVFAVIASLQWHVRSPWLIMLIGMIAAAVIGTFFAIATVVIRANQVLVGLALALGGVGLSNQLGNGRTGSPLQTVFNRVTPSRTFTTNQFLEAFFHQDPIVYVAYIVLPAILWFVLYRTRHGLIVRAVGENPGAVDAVGSRVLGLRFAYTVLGTAISGAAGAYMVLTITPTWSADIARGRGWVALAVVIFASWKPFRVVVGALLFGAMISLDATTQARGWHLPFFNAVNLSFFLSMLPYLVTLIAILIPAGAAQLGRKAKAAAAPAALATPYFREER
jgi:simple sugar transport system permease protein